MMLRLGATTAVMCGMASVSFADACLDGLGEVDRSVVSDACAPNLVTRPALEDLGVPVTDYQLIHSLGATEDGRPLVTQSHVMRLAPGSGMLMDQLRQQKAAEFQQIAEDFVARKRRDVCSVFPTDTTRGMAAFHAAGGVMDYQLNVMGFGLGPLEGYSETLAAGRIDDCEDN